jgi:spore coat protein U-like protein
MKMLSHVGFLGVLILSLVEFPALGATISASFGVSATVEAKCLVSSAVPSYSDLTSAMASAPSGLSVSCNFNAPYTLVVSKRASSGTMLPVTAADIKNLPIHESLLQESSKLANYPTGYRDSPVSATESVVATKLQYNSPGAPTDTIVLEVTY